MSISVSAVELVDRIGATQIVLDCEARDGRWWEQSVNTWSSLAYVAVGVFLAAAAARRRLPLGAAVLGFAIALEGVGSVLFHGAESEVSLAIHDLALFAVAGFIVAWHIGRLRGTAESWSVAGAGVGLVVGGGIWLIERGSTNAIVGTAIVAVVVADLLARRRGLTPVANRGLVVFAGIAVTAWFLGRAESPLCDPDSPLQFHALWHLLSAALLLGWADRAYTVSGSARPLRPVRHIVDRSFGLVAWLVVRAFHRSVEVVGRHRIPTDRPVLLVANHGNGFVDPVIVAAVLGRIPRFLAKATLWDVWLARPFLGLLGVLPIHRAVDGPDTSANQQTFSAAWRELALCSTVAIFPEGTTGDRHGLDRVRTGAARLALGAVEHVEDLVVLPIGLAFESRIETRSRAVVIVGEPIPAADWYRRWQRETDHDDRAGDLPAEAVNDLTAEIRRALEAVSPEFASVDERDLLRASARVACVAEPRRSDATFGSIERLARQLAAAPPEHRAAVIDAYRTYATRLQLLRLHDDDILPRRGSRLRLLGAVAALVFFGSVVVTATLVHLPAILLVVISTGLVTSTATKGTVRLLVGAVAGLATWVTAGLLIGDGWGAVAAGVTTALGGAIALATWTPLLRALARIRGALRARERAGLVPRALEDRATLLAQIDAALTATIPTARAVEADRVTTAS